MAHDWAADVKKYVADANDAEIKGIIKHCGIALHNKDSSYVACGDKAERDRVRDGFLKKKLALTVGDAELDKAIVEVCGTKKGDRDKSRVAFYYLLASKFGKLSLFG